MKSSKILFLTLAFFVSASFLQAQVNEPEIKSVGDTIEFINYVGPHSKIDSLSAIKEIGSGLGARLAPAKKSYASAGEKSRYSVIHAVDPNEKGKLDADIFFIGSGATVDHITNVRRIVSAYLTAAYGYSSKDADTLAVFITVYNAVYRNNLEVFQNKYKAIVTKNLTQKDCGISIRYSEWPGSTQMVIPLYDVEGGLSTVDTTVISDKKVVESMQEEPDKQIATRKDMVDIKEREQEKATEKAQTAQKKATEENKKLAEEKAKNKTAQQKAEEAREKADENPKDKKAQAEAAKAEKEAEAQQQKTDAQEEKANEASKEAEEAQKLADRKEDEIQKERTEIANDQQEIIDTEIANARAGSVYGMQLTDDTEKLSGLVKVNSETGDVIHASPVTVLRQRTFYTAGQNFVAIAGQNVGNGIVKLVALDSANMEIVKESAETVSENSVLVEDGGLYYCIIQDGSNWVLAQYDANVKLLKKSNVSLSQSSPVSIAPEAIVVTDATGKIKLLNKNDLGLLVK